MADIDKALPNVEQNITVPSEAEIEEAQLEQEEALAEQGDPVEIQENEDGSVDINYDPAIAAVEGAENHYANLAEHLPDEVLGPLGSTLFSNYQDYKNFTKNVIKEDQDFVLFFNSRNIRRKQIPDTLLAWKYFYDQLPKEKQDKVKFILHTEIVSEHGTDLMAVKNYLFGEEDKSILFSTSKLSPQQLNYFYNIADAQILLTSNEGWGLSLTEALLAGTPIIANVTGGMQDQMRFEDENGNWFTPNDKIPSNHTGKYKKCGKWAFPVFPTNRSLQGSPQTPYIWDDRCRPEDAAEQIMKLYNMTREERKTLGLEGHKWATGEEAGFTAKLMTQRVIEGVDKTFANFKSREKFEFINANEFSSPLINHELLY